MEFRLKYEGPWAEASNLHSKPVEGLRYDRPVIKMSKCCQCGWCYLYCPTGSILEEPDHFAIDLNYCKGCGVCASVCPVDAIMMVREADITSED